MGFFLLNQKYMSVKFDLKVPKWHLQNFLTIIFVIIVVFSFLTPKFVDNSIKIDYNASDPAIKQYLSLEISNLYENVDVYHAGTALDGESYVTNGGRVLAITATGDSLRAAIDTAYNAVNTISFSGMQ